VKVSVAMKRFTALVRKSKIAFNKPLHIKFEVWPQSWRKLLSTYLAYAIDSGNRIRFSQSEYDKLQLTEMWRNRSEGISA